MTELTVKQAIQADRNASVLTWLARLQLATAEQISALGWPGVSRSVAAWRLRRVGQAGLVEAVATKIGNGRRARLLRLTPAGAIAAARLLGESGVIQGVRIAATEGIHLEHRLRVNDTVLSLIGRLGSEVAEVLLPHSRRLRWPISGGAWHEVTSDAVLLFTGLELALVIEYDRGLRSLEGIAEQLQRYREASAQPDLPVWAARASIVYALHPPSRARARSILRLAADEGLEGRVAVIAAADLVPVVTDAVAAARSAAFEHGPDPTARTSTGRQGSPPS